MSNIHLKVAVEKNWRAQNLDFLRFKNFPQLQLTAPTHANVIKI